MRMPRSAVTSQRARVTRKSRSFHINELDGIHLCSLFTGVFCSFIYAVRPLKSAGGAKGSTRNDTAPGFATTAEPASLAVVGSTALDVEDDVADDDVVEVADAVELSPTFNFANAAKFSGAAKAFWILLSDGVEEGTALDEVLE